MLSCCLVLESTFHNGACNNEEALNLEFHLAVLCDSSRCGAYGTYCYGISWYVIMMK